MLAKLDHLAKRRPNLAKTIQTWPSPAKPITSEPNLAKPCQTAAFDLRDALDLPDVLDLLDVLHLLDETSVGQSWIFGRS